MHNYVLARYISCFNSHSFIPIFFGFGGPLQGEFQVTAFTSLKVANFYVRPCCNGLL